MGHCDNHGEDLAKFYHSANDLLLMQADSNRANSMNCMGHWDNHGKVDVDEDS